MAHSLGIAAFILLAVGLIAVYEHIQDTTAHRTARAGLLLSWIGVGLVLPYYEREEEFLKLWHEADALLRARGGYLTTRLHKALQPDSRYQYINIAELDSVETWKAAITSPEFTAITGQMAGFHPAPGLYTVTVSHGKDTSTRPS